MGKREKKIEVIRKYIDNAAGNWPAYSYGSIPKNKIANACYSYAGAIEKNDVLGLIDITVAGNGKKGLLFTEHKVYYNNGVFGKSGSISYKQIYNDNAISYDIFDTAYNETALTELLSMLATIEGTSTADSIGNTIDELESGFESFTSVVEKGVNFLNTLSTFFSTDDSSDTDE